jgi:hypothetical protein
MTILNDLFNRAEELWNSIQGTADDLQQVVVYAATSEFIGDGLEYSPHGPFVRPIERLIYNPPSAVLKVPATFAGLGLTIMAPNFHTIPLQPNYQVRWEDELSTPSTVDPFGAFYFQNHHLVVVTLGNLRLEAPPSGS